MTAFGATTPIIQGIMFIAFTAVLLVDIACVLYSISIKTKLNYTLLSMALFAITFSSLTVFVIGYIAEYHNTEVGSFIKGCYALPIFVVVLYAVFLSAVSAFFLLMLSKWKRTHLSAMSIKESIDELPSGLCYYNENGLVLLMNNEIAADCMTLTGKALLNANEFWASLVSDEILDGNSIIVDGEKPIIKMKDGTVKNFIRNERKENGTTVYELISTNITEEYSLSEEREKKNEALKHINARLREYGEQITSLTREKEVLAAKIRIHDETGRLLLASQRSITEPRMRQALLASWEQTVTAFGIVSDENTPSNPIDDLIEAAKDSGVIIKYNGIRPDSGSIAERIMANALHECLTNTITHGNGTEMTVTVTEDKSLFIVQIINNGKNPNADIVEGGGLSSLRALVERENGEMIVQSLPEFVLTIRLPKVGGNENAL